MSRSSRGRWLNVLLSVWVVLAGAVSVEATSLQGRFEQYEALRETGTQKLWQARVHIAEKLGETVVFERGEGLYHGADEPVVWENKLRFHSEDPGRLLSASRTIFSSDGQRVLKSIQRDYDPTTKTLTLTIDQNELADDLTTRTWEGIERFATSGSLPFLIQHRLREGGAIDEPITLITSKAKSYSVRPTVEGHERIVVPEGVFDCVKVTLNPAGTFLKFLAPLFPEIAFWYTQDDFQFVKYEGLEHGMGSARVVMQRMVQLD